MSVLFEIGREKNTEIVNLTGVGQFTRVLFSPDTCQNVGSRFPEEKLFISNANWAHKGTSQRRRRAHTT